MKLGRVRVDAVSMVEAVELVAGRIRSGAPGYVLTPNVDHVVQAERDGRLAQAYAEAFLALPDGMPVVWASRALGRPVAQKVSGSDLVGPLLERAAREGWGVYFLGGQPGSAGEAARRARERLGSLRVVGAEGPAIAASADDEASRQAFARLCHARPQLLLVGLGCPKQEFFLQRYAAHLPGTVSLGVGASIDFLAGAERRAPQWMSAHGLEWVYRLAREPRRLWRRYLLRDPAFAWILVRALVARATEHA